jgi:hypothetical protein
MYLSSRGLPCRFVSDFCFPSSFLPFQVPRSRFCEHRRARRNAGRPSPPTNKCSHSQINSPRPAGGGSGWSIAKLSPPFVQSQNPARARARAARALPAARPAAIRQHPPAPARGTVPQRTGRQHGGARRTHSRTHAHSLHVITRAAGLPGRTPSRQLRPDTPPRLCKIGPVLRLRLAVVGCGWLLLAAIGCRCCMGVARVAACWPAALLLACATTRPLPCPARASRCGVVPSPELS